MSKPKKKNTNRNVIICLFLIIILLVGYTVLQKYRMEKNQFRYEDHLNDIVVSIDEQTITLKEFGYYIYEMEAYFQNQAIVYNPDDPNDYWNTHFSIGVDSAFIYNYAWKYAINNCVCDVIYENMAQKENYVLTTEEQEMARENANEIYGEMSEVQKQNICISLEDIIKVQERKLLVEHFVIDYAKQVDTSNYTGNLIQQLSANGEYFQKYILANHDVVYNDDIESKIRMGKITVNCD